MTLEIKAFGGEWPFEQHAIPISSEACPVCGTAGARYTTHVCMTAGVPSYDPAADLNQKSGLAG